jgi:SOS regulatory protein LexA
MSLERYKQSIMRFYGARRRMPSYSEIMELCAFKSKNAAAKLVDKLVALGVIEKGRDGRIVPSRLFDEVRILGTVQAGIPVDATEENLDTLSIDDYLIDKRDATFLLTVKGDSMIDAGIREGDLVVVEKTTTAKLGEIVIAEVDGEWTMKYLRRDKSGTYYLEPANESFDDIYPEGELKIGGIVRGVVRKY